MALAQINLGDLPNDGTGDPLREGGAKINANFAELDDRTLNPNLQALSGLTGAANRLPYYTGIGALSLTILSALGRQLIASTAPSDGRNVLGLGSAATVGLGVAGGAASLGADGKLRPEQTPDMSINNVYPVNSQAAMLALPANRGDIAIRTDEQNKPYILTTLPPTTLANWTVIGQSLSAALAAISGLTPAADRLAYYTGSNTADLTPLTSFARSMLDDVNAGAVLTTLGVSAYIQTLLDDANAAAARTTLGLGSASVANILGTVSQTGGVPTGAIVEAGSSANGQYTKFADGTMICRLLITGLSIAMNSSYGSGTVGTTNWAYPAAFVSTPVLTLGARGAGKFTTTSPADAASATLGSFLVFDPAGSIYTGSFNCFFLAIGRWF